VAARLSPDGSRLAFVVLGEAGRQVGDFTGLWVYDRPADEYVYLGEGMEPAWSPSGRQLAFLAPSPLGYQLQLVEPPRRERRTLTQLRPGVNFSLYAPSIAWSRRGDRIAFTHEVHASLPRGAEDPPRLDAEVYTNSHLSVLDLASGGLESLLESIDPLRGCAWSENDRELYYQIAVTSAPQRLALGAYSLDSRSARPLLAAGTQGWGISPAPGGGKIAFVRPHVDETGERVRQPYALAIVATGTGAMDALLDRHAFGPGLWSPDGGSLYVSLATGSGARPVVIDVGRREAKGLLTPEKAGAPGSVLIADLSADGRWLAVIGQDFTMSPEAWLVDLASGQWRRVSRASRRLEGFHLAEGEVVGWKVPDGLEFEGILLRPAAGAGDVRPPLVVDLAGGGPVGRRLDPHWQYLASLGFLVFVPDHRLSGTQGAEPIVGLETRNERERWAAAAEDVLAGVKAVARAHGVDPARVYLRAGAEGSRLALWMLAWGRIFSAAVLRQPLELPPEEEIQRLAAPTLFLVGGSDPAANAMRPIAARLEARGWASEVVVYRDEGIVFRSAETVIDAARRTGRWFQGQASGGSESTPATAPPVAGREAERSNRGD